MKILQINKFYFLKGQAGGAARYFFDLMKLLEGHGHQVMPFSMKHPDNLATPYEKYFVSNVDLSRPKFSWQMFKALARVFWSREASRKLARLIKKAKPDLAHCHNIYYHLSSSILPVLKKYQIPVVMTVHDFKLICPNYSLFCQNQTCGICQGGKYYHCFFRKCIKNSRLASLVATAEAYFQKWSRFYQKYLDLFLCPSQLVAQRLIAAGFPADKIKVLPHFISFCHCEEPPTCAQVGGDAAISSPALPQSMRLFRRNDKADNDRYYLYFGRLEKIKGADLLIEAAKQIPEAKLKIAGSGSEEMVLKNQAAQLKNVEFLGWQAPRQLQGLIQQAQFVVVPSRGYETFGLSTLEAFSQAKAVIAANHGALPELVKHGQNGLLFQPASSRDLAAKIKYLWSRPSLTEKMGQRAQKLIIEKYNPEGHYQKLMGYYKNLK